MAGLKFYTIPEGREAEWASRVSALGTVSEEAGWNGLRDFHNNENSEWPGIVHGREYGRQRSSLLPFQVNLWRTVWLYGRAMKELNKNYKGTLAITFELEAETKSKPKSVVETQKGRLGKRDEDKDRGKKKSIRKKISKYFKGIFTSSSETG